MKDPAAGDPEAQLPKKATLKRENINPLRNFIIRFFDNKIIREFK